MLKKEEYIIEDKTISIEYANFFALLIMIISAVLSIGIIISWKINWTKEYLIANILNVKLMVASTLLIASIIIHECIHAVTFKLFLKGEKECVKISIDKNSLTPYCHCKEKLRLWQYAIAIIAPGIILGLIPYILAIYYKDIIWLCFSWINFSAAGGDILIILKIIKYGKFNVWVMDHPEKVGFLVCEKAE